MLYNFNGKNLRISDEEINKSMAILGLSKEEAIQMWLEDEGFLINEEQEALCQKSKENKIKHGARASKPGSLSRKRERKPDEEKESIIKLLSECLELAGYHAEITNKSKIIEFNVGENNYKLDLIRKRAPKKQLFIDFLTDF